VSVNLNAKILIFIAATTTAIFATTIGYITMNMRDNSLRETQKLADSYAREYANRISGELSNHMWLSQTLANSFKGYEGIPDSLRGEIYDRVLWDTFEGTLGDYLAVWCSWEMSAYVPGYDKPFGRLRSSVFLENDKMSIISQAALDTEGFNTGAYGQIQRDKEQFITDPYSDSYRDGTQFLMASICAPIIKSNSFIGLAGVDISLESFQEITQDIKPFPESYAFFMAHNGAFVSHPQPEYINAKMAEVNPEDEARHNITQRVQNGETFSIVGTNGGNDKYYITFAPVNVGQSKTPWSLGIVVPMAVIEESANEHLGVSIVVGLFGLLILMVGTLFLANYITKPLKKITKILESLSMGDFEDIEKMEVKTTDEIGQIRVSVNTLIDGLKRTTDFARSIGHGDLSAHFQLLSDKDELGNALLEMRKSLSQARDENARRVEEDKRMNWSTRGLARFSEILRENADDMEEFTYTILSNLVRYMDAQIGGLYLINDERSDDRHLEMVAVYAYERRRFIEHRIEIGEGIVGRCVLENQSIFMTDIPEDYIQIDSGLGHDKPTSLLVVPLKLNEEVYGIVELASFSEFQRYQIEFVEKIGENIAATLSNVKINLRTARLLEESKLQSEALVAKENEMKNYIREMEITQKEADRKEEVAQSFVNAVNHSIIRADFNLDGRLLYANSRFLETMEYSSAEAQGKHVALFFLPKDRDAFGETFDKLVRGSRHFEQEVEHKTQKASVWLLSTFTAMRDRDGIITKILFLAIDISKLKKIEARLDMFLENARKQNRDLRASEEMLKSEVEMLKKEKESLRKELEDMRLGG